MGSHLDLVVRDASVITETEFLKCDLGIADGKIAALQARLPRADREIDAKGLVVMPGGIDSHCHIEQSTAGGLITADDFYSAGISAVCGGTTMLLPFVAPQRGQSLRAEFHRYLKRGRENSVVDFSFHLSATDPDPQIIEEELPEILRLGCPSLKIYMTYDALKLTDRQILDVLDIARREHAMVMVHAENSEVIAWLTDRLLRSGKTAPRFHAASRPSIVEREAAHRIISLAEIVDIPILIVHVSAGETLEQIRWARNRGRQVYAETCPQYLTLTEAELNRPGFEGAKFICSPPLRSPADQQELWDALVDGRVQVVSSDHAPYRFGDARGKQASGAEASFDKVPSGLPGLETRLPILFSEGVAKGRIDRHQFVALAATNAARLYGLYPRKGTIALGSDADLAIWDPGKQVAVSKEMLHDTMDYTPFEGMLITGWPVITLSRGEILYRDNRVSAARGRGQFIARSESFLL